MAQPSSQALPPPHPPAKSRTGLYVAGAVVVIVVVIVGALAAAGAFSSKSNGGGAGPGQLTIATAGTVWNLNAGQYESVGAINLISSASWTISGAYTATHGIDVYILTSTEYSTWGGSGSPSSYYWTSGSGVTSGGISTYLPANTYYFVWENTNIITATSVQIISNVVATASS